MNDCNVIFETRHHPKAFILNLIIEFKGTFPYQDANEFYLNGFCLQFEKLIKGGPLQSNDIKETFERFDLRRICKLLMTPKNVSSFSELAYFLDNEH